MKKGHLMITILLYIAIQFLFFSLAAIDNVHFYRPNFYWGEPRLECPWLNTIDVAVGTGKTRSGYNGKGKKTNILNIYGVQNMHKLADNATDLNPANSLDAILINLNNLPEQKNFGQLKLKGKFHTIESDISIYQNIKHGFFFQLHIPARKLSVNPNIENQNDLAALDLSPEGTTPPNKTSPEWQAFLNNFFSILKQQNISVRPLNRSGIGDVSLLAGWSCSYQNTTYLDFIDVAAKIGVLFPTGKKRNPDNVFDLPQGYDGHWGVPLKFDLSIGAWEWFTGGLHIGSLFLAERTKTLRIQTSDTQNSFIKLTKTEATFDPGIYFDFDLFIKGDHLWRGFSVLLAYSFNFKEKDNIEPKRSDFNKKIANNDIMLAGWNQHILHFLIEYDFAKKMTDIGTRIGIFYNHVLDGKRMWRTHMKGGSIGLDCAWRF